MSAWCCLSYTIHRLQGLSHSRSGFVWNKTDRRRNTGNTSANDQVVIGSHVEMVLCFGCTVWFNLSPRKTKCCAVLLFPYVFLVLFKFCFLLIQNNGGSLYGSLLAVVKKKKNEIGRLCSCSETLKDSKSKPGDLENFRF